MATPVRLDVFKSNKEEILSRVDAQEIIGGLVPLKKRGSSSEGLCPFHEEKTPSFRVYQDNYHCFGCGQHGDAVDFVRKHLGLSFPDAMRWIANKIGMEYLVSRDGEDGKPTVADEHRILRDVQAEFQRNLRISSEAISYAASRGLDSELCERLGVGYAPNKRILGAIAGRDSTQMLRKLGMIRDDGQRPDRELFSGRLMFPIYAPVSQRYFELKGFAGRVLGDGTPKYINSPDSDWFKKGHALYGWDAHSMLSIRKSGVAILVEGFLDVVQCRKHGIENVLACMGTAVTKEQLDLVFSYANKIIVALDGDDAGYRGLLKAAVTALPLLNAQRDIGFVRLRGGDPDEILRGKGARELLDQLKSSCSDVIQLVIEAVSSEVESVTLLGRRMGLMQKVDSLLRDNSDELFREMALDRAKELVMSGVV